MYKIAIEDNTTNGVASARVHPIVLLIGYVVALIVFALFSLAEYTLLSSVLAWVLFVIGTYPFVLYINSKKTYLPVIELVLLVYVSAFSLPILFESEHVILIKTLYADTEPIALTLSIVILAVCSMYFGFRVAPLVFNIIQVPRLNLVCHPTKLYYYAIVLEILFLGKGLIDSPEVSGLLNIIANQDISIAILALLFYSNVLSSGQKAVSLSVLIFAILYGVTTSSTQSMLQPILIWGCCRWIAVRKFELRFVVLLVILFVLIQPVKLEYRSIWRDSNTSASMFNKLDSFSTIFRNHWFSSSDLAEKIDDSTGNRSSLLLTSAHVVDFTPDIVPYLNGKSYYYMFSFFIPRLIWADKSTAQEGNIYYATSYGITTVEGAETTMYGVGQLGEAVMNFGIIGIVPVFLLIGLLYYIPVRLIHIPREVLDIDRDRNYFLFIASAALFVATVANMLYIERTLADIFGGVIQLIVLQGFLMYFFCGIRGRTIILK